jgi:hypothetical protein
MTMKKSFVSALCLLATLAPTPALAQSDAEIALARKWFREGEQAEKSKDYAAALERFEKALAIKTTPQLLLRVGSAQERLGRLVEAMLSYDRALEAANAAALKDVAAVAKDQADALRPRLPTLTLEPAATYDGLTVALDGVALSAATLGSKLPVNPGEHQLVIEANGHQKLAKTITLAESEAKKLPFELADASSLAPEPTPDAPTTPDPVRPSKLPAYLLVGGGVVAVGVGVALFAVAAGKDGAIDDDCGGSERQHCPVAMKDDITARVSSVNTLQTTSFILGGVGLVGAGIGTYLLLRHPKAAPTAAFLITPTLDARGAPALYAQGHF